MKYKIPGTLAYYQDAPQFKMLDLHAIDTPVFGQATEKYLEGIELSYPDRDAINFYAINHCASIVMKKFTPNEKLDDWAIEVMDSYMGVLADQGKRNLLYMLSIVTREARHLNQYATSIGDEWWEKLEALSGKNFKTFVQLIVECNENKAVEAFRKSSPDCTIKEYTQGMVYLFDKGKWGGGYGGKKWGQIAQCAYEFVVGNTSMEMMVDTAYTLCHNNGPMYNKGMMYQMYESLSTILDIQRSGQIPELVLDTTKWMSATASDEVAKVVKLVKEQEPNEFGSWIDWRKVVGIENDPHKYSHYFVKQDKAHPAGSPVTIIKGKPVKMVGEFEVYPGQAAKVYERVKKEALV